MGRLLNMIAAALLKLIPTHYLSALALQTQVDHQVKKLSGEVMFKLILPGSAPCHFRITKCRAEDTGLVTRGMAAVSLSAHINQSEETRRGRMGIECLHFNLDSFQLMH